VADYPELIYFDSKTEDEFVWWLDNELFLHFLERGDWLQDLIHMQHSYWAEPLGETVTFPFNGAANLVVPLNAIAVEAIHARVMNTIFGLDQIITAKAVSPDWEEAVQPIETFLNYELLDNVKVYTPVNDSCLEITKFGTAILKSGYQKIVKQVMREVDGKQELVKVIAKQGATLESVALGRFLMPFASQDEQMSLWCGEEHSMTPHEIWLHEQAGLFYPGTYEKLKTCVTQTDMYGEREFERSQEDLQRQQIVLPALIDFQEVWCAWNTDANEDNVQKEIVCFYHRMTRTLMAVRYNWYSDLRRPYRRGVYFPIEHRWYGIGVIKQNDQFQQEITTKHRQMLDNATLANMRMIRVTKMSGYGPGEPVFPGKIWVTDNKDDIDTFQMGEIYPSAYNSEQSTLVYSQQRTGVNELTLGQPGAGTPGTASDVLSRIQEGNKKFGFVFKNVSRFVESAFNDVVCNIQQFGPRNIEYYDTAEHGQLVQKFFNMPEEFIRNGLLVKLNLSNELENKLIDRQNFVQIGQMYQQYATGQIEMAQLLQNPQLVTQIVNQLQYGSTEIMKQFLESFDLRNIDRILINARSFNTGGAQGTSLNGAPTGMDNTAQIGAGMASGLVPGANEISNG
jgi:hypothetical protein